MIVSSLLVNEFTAPTFCLFQRRLSLIVMQFPFHNFSLRLQTVISLRSLECVGCSLCGARWCLHLFFHAPIEPPIEPLQLPFHWHRSVDRWRLSTVIVMVWQI